MAHDSDHESINDNFEQNLEDEVIRTSNDEDSAKVIATELGKALAVQFTSLTQNLQQSFSSLEREMMTQAKHTRRKR